MFGREALQSRGNIKAERSKGSTRNSLQSEPKGSSFTTNLSQSGTPRVSHGAGNSNRSSNRPLCPFCSRSHEVDDCDQFSKQTAEQRRAFLREKQLCFGCYGKHHISKHCVKKRRCKHCGRHHPTALHIDGFQLVKQDSKNCAKPEAGMSSKIKTTIQPVFISRKLNEDVKVREVKPATVNQQCVVYKFQCNLCDAGYVGYTRGHLHERVDGHKQKSSSICKHYLSEHNSNIPPHLLEQFHVLTKCSNKFDCLIKEMLFIRKLKPSLNVQTDSIRAKVFT